MNECSFLYYIPSKSEFVKIQPGTGDNLSPEDISAGFTDYILWNRFHTGPLDIDGELEMECMDGGMLMFKSQIPGQTGDDGGGKADADLRQHDLLKSVLEQVYGDRGIEAIQLFKE